MSNHHEKSSFVDRLGRISKELADLTNLDAECKYVWWDVVRRVYDYVRVHRLTNKKDHRIIECDERLGNLLNCNSSSASSSNSSSASNDDDGGPNVLTYVNLPKYLKRHFERKRRTSKAKNSKFANKMECPCAPRLRRCFAIVPNNVDQEMKLSFLDLANRSNKDIRTTTECFRRQNYRHPRARQLAAACRYGWVVTPLEAYKPEDFMSRLSDATLRFEEKTRNMKKSI